MLPASTMPPHATAEQVEGFALTMGKLVLSGHVEELLETVEANLRHF